MCTPILPTSHRLPPPSSAPQSFSASFSLLPIPSCPCLSHHHLVHPSLLPFCLNFLIHISSPMHLILSCCFLPLIFHPITPFCSCLHLHISNESKQLYFPSHGYVSTDWLVYTYVFTPSSSCLVDPLIPTCQTGHLYHCWCR